MTGAGFFLLSEGCVTAPRYVAVETDVTSSDPQTRICAATARDILHFDRQIKEQEQIRSDARAKFMNEVVSKAKTTGEREAWVDFVKKAETGNDVFAEIQRDMKDIQAAAEGIREAVAPPAGKKPPKKPSTAMAAADRLRDSIEDMDAGFEALKAARTPEAVSGAQQKLGDAGRAMEAAAVDIRKTAGKSETVSGLLGRISDRRGLLESNAGFVSTFVANREALGFYDVSVTTAGNIASYTAGKGAAQADLEGCDPAKLPETHRANLWSLFRFGK